jgi:hypothetical protein
MTPVMQTIHTAPGGNCFQASVASVLDLPLESVPHFFAASDGGMWTQSEWDAVRCFAEGIGVRAFWLDPMEAKDQPFVEILKSCGLFYVAFGPSTVTPFGHCVVMNNGAYVHDPSGGRFLGGEPWLFVGFEKVTH